MAGVAVAGIGAGTAAALLLGGGQPATGIDVQIDALSSFHGGR